LHSVLRCCWFGEKKGTTPNHNWGCIGTPLHLHTYSIYQNLSSSKISFKNGEHKNLPLELKQAVKA